MTTKWVKCGAGALAREELRSRVGVNGEETNR
jgi:hypothetical protein